jgi:hypothetical protein
MPQSPSLRLGCARTPRRRREPSYYLDVSFRRCGAWLRTKPTLGIAFGEAELANALDCLLARQPVLGPAIPCHDVVKLSAKAFIRALHEWIMVP